MAATLLSAKVDGLSARRSLRFTDGKAGIQQSFRVIYLVRTNDAGDGPAIVLSAAGLPQLGTPYNVGNEFVSRCICSDLDVQATDNRTVWQVVATYTNDIDRDPAEETENPLDAEPDVAMTFNSAREIIPGYYANSSAPAANGDYDLGIVTPAGQLFSPAPEYDISRPVYSVTVNVSTISNTSLSDWANAVNDTTFMGYSARQLRMSPPTAQKLYDEDIGKYWRVTYAWEYKRETWDTQVLNRGTIYKTSTGGYIDTVDTSLAGQTVLLTSTGGKIAPGSTARSFTRVQCYKVRNFNDLSFFSTTLFA